MFSAWVLGGGCDPTHQQPPVRPFLGEMQLFLTISSILHFYSGGAEFQRLGPHQMEKPFHPDLLSIPRINNLNDWDETRN